MTRDSGGEGQAHVEFRVETPVLLVQRRADAEDVPNRAEKISRNSVGLSSLNLPEGGEKGSGGGMLLSDDGGCCLYTKGGSTNGGAFSPPTASFSLQRVQSATKTYR